MAAPKKPGIRVAAIVAVVVAMVGASLYGSGEYAAARVREDVALGASHRLEVYTVSLHNAVEKFAYFPFTVSLNGDLAHLIARPNDEALRARVNSYLETVNDQAAAAVLYVMNGDGVTVASSNWKEPQSFLGLRLGFRPYFGDAMQGRQGRFYGVGSTTGLPGYFISAPVRDGERIVGAVAVKVSLDKMEASWNEATEKVMVLDRYGIVFLTSDPDWKFRTLTPLSEEARAYLGSTRQYGRDRFDALELNTASKLAELFDGKRRQSFVIEQREVSPLGWRLVLLADATPVLVAARTARIGGALVLFTLFVLMLYVHQRRRRIHEALAARTALEQAHQGLERKVEERTADLVTANRELRDAQAELVQAAKMAVLGQMAAGITHELNQPLTAMRSLAENASTLIANGSVGEVKENLRLIARLVDRMGKITGQLRDFSRKSPGDAQPVALNSAIAEALALLDRRIQEQRVRIVQDLPSAPTWVLFDPIRLQQVLVNLVRNALDALREKDEGGAIEITASAEDDRIHLAVADNGPGIPHEALPHVFDPFFTTKPAGVGLGLGLGVSLAIAREYGAALEAANGKSGARFTLSLERCKSQEGDRGG